MKIALYLDVDGVILGGGEGENILVPDIENILRYTKKHFECFWLTTHGRNGTEDVIRYLTPFSLNINLSIYEHIEAVRWDALKTEAIDFSKPFIWIDDRPLTTELRILESRGCLRNWLHVDTFRNIHDLTVEKIEAKRRELLR